MTPRAHRWISTLAATSLIGASMLHAAQAGVIETPQVAAQAAAQAPSGQQRLAQTLAREDVARLLAAQGVSLKEAQARVAALDDDEAAQLAQQIESAPAGGMGALGAVALVFVVLVVLDILGFTHIFSFTSPIK